MNNIRRAAFTASIIDCVMFCGFLYGVYCLMTIQFGVSADTASAIITIVFVLVGLLYSWVTAIIIQRIEYTSAMIEQEVERQQKLKSIQKKVD